MDPFQIRIDERRFLTLPHDEDRAEYLTEHPEVDPRDVAIIMVTMFRNKGYMDFVEVVEIDDVEDDYSTHICLGKLTLVSWLAGFTLDEKREKELEETERIAGKFGERFGWYPTLTIEDEPAEYVEDVYMRWSLRDLENSIGVPEDFLKEDS